MFKPSLKRPRSPSTYFPSIDHSHGDNQDYESSVQNQGRPLIRNLRALEAELCQLDRLGMQSESPVDQIEGGRLIRLKLDPQEEHPQQQNSVWVDRYDARLLLSPPASNTTLSNLQPQITSPPAQSPTGFSDLPSDHEEMFYFEPEERREIAQKKLRRRRDDERSVRIKLREEEDKLREEQLKLSKIPPVEQITLMKRTLEALKGSPSPSLLEIRILTNHGSDPRFSSFLRRDGKWRSYWESMKTDPDPAGPSACITTTQPLDPVSSSSVQATVGLVDYGNSSDENENEGYHIRTKAVEMEEKEEADPDPPPANDRPSPRQTSSVDEDRDITETIDGVISESEPTTQDCRYQDGKPEPSSNVVDQNLLQFDSTVSESHPAPENVDPIERLSRQQRAKLWAEKRKKSHPVLPNPHLPAASS